MSDGRAALAEFFDGRVAVYDGAYDSSGSGGHTLRARMSVVLDLAGDGPGEALDLGMGPGRLCAALAERGWTVSGVDGSQAMVERARSRLPQAAERLLQAAATALPFADASFDLLTATGVIEYVHDRPAVLAEISRVLRPGGAAVISVPNPIALYARFYRPHARAVKTVHRALRSAGPYAEGGGWIRPDAFEALLAAAGLKRESTSHAGYLLIPVPFDGIAPKLAARLAGRLEGRGPRLGAMLATQVVFAARRS